MGQFGVSKEMHSILDKEEGAGYRVTIDSCPETKETRLWKAARTDTYISSLVEGSQAIQVSFSPTHKQLVFFSFPFSSFLDTFAESAEF